MEKIRPDIAGSRKPRLYYSLCYEALVDRRVIFVIGQEKSKIMSFFISVIDPARWRISFLIRHPFLGIDRAFNITFDRLKKPFNKANKKKQFLDSSSQNISDYLEPLPSNKSWYDSSPEIAKLLFYAVDINYRGLNISRALTEYALTVLSNRGARRVDGKILFDNIPSIRTLHRIGFNIHSTGDQLFATKDI